MSSLAIALSCSASTVSPRTTITAILGHPFLALLRCITDKTRTGGKRCDLDACSNGADAIICDEYRGAADVAGVVVMPRQACQNMAPRSKRRSCFYRLVVLAMAALGMGACEHLVDPMLPSNAAVFSPPAVYQRWWTMTEACSGITGSFEAISWYRIPWPTPVLGNNNDVDGYWSAASNRIVLSDTASLDGATVRHEMLHALVRAPGHSRNQFLGHCAGYVACFSECVADAGPVPADTAGLKATADSLDVWTEVDPAQPATQSDGGAFRITVFAHNRLNRAISLDLQSIPISSGFGTGFHYALIGTHGGISSGVAVLDASSLRFAPGETKQCVFDFWIGNALTSKSAPPDAYRVQGSFGRHDAAYVNFTIAP